MWWVGTRKKRMALSLQIQRNLWLVHLCWVLEWGEGVSPLKILRRKSDNLTWPPAENVPQAEEPHTFMDGIWPWASHPGLLALSGDRHSDFPCLRHCNHLYSWGSAAARERWRHEHHRQNLQKCTLSNFPAGQSCSQISHGPTMDPCRVAFSTLTVVKDVYWGFRTVSLRTSRMPGDWWILLPGQNHVDSSGSGQ